MAGLPVVTTNVGSIPEVVLNNVTGVVTELKVQQIADALEKLANNQALRAQMGITAKEFVLANFGVQRLIIDHEELYKSLVSSPTKF